MMNWDMEELREVIVPLLVLRDTIRRDTNLQPTAMMLPLSLAPNIDTAWGIPVMRGDRAALIYEPVRSGA